MYEIMNVIIYFLNLLNNDEKAFLPFRNSFQAIEIGINDVK